MNMKKSMLSASIISVLMTVPMAYAGEVFKHKDNRSTDKLVFEPIFTNTKNANGEALARAFLQSQAKAFGLPANLSNLQLNKTKQSLTATHYHFQQVLNGVPVLQAEAIVSVSNNNNRILKAFNNTYPVSGKVAAAKAILAQQDALDKAWRHLQSADQLRREPSSELFYVPVDGQFVLAYRTRLAATKVRGDWEHLIDAHTGAVLRARRIDLPLSQKASEALPEVKASTPQRAFVDALASWQKNQQSTKAVASALLVDGSAKTFDPDPRTTLNNASLIDTSSAASFTAAYQTKVLKEITFDAGASVYRLTGPWVVIANIGQPNTVPSTSATGNWTQERGDNAFNDANTYFHIDQNQRYIQSLGFTGPLKGIQNNPIQVDTDGADGEDQSFFSPAQNYLEFGHGCVDDNEDADVILHEYGHGLQWDINNNWDGGDTGAMGEGFGDYWAGSYSYSTPNGQTFDPALVFTWDGPGCWSGRRMDRTTYQYDPLATYGAHAEVNGQLGDELWSTPLFQSLVDLIAAGTPRTEVDQIVLESHFGLGTGMTMREMAESTVLAATTLFPTGSHDDVFRANFQEVNILPPSGNVAPVARVAQSSISVATGGSVTLNASSSTDANGDILSFTWTQLSGTTVTLSSTTSAQATFTAPSSAGTLQFQVSVSDGTVSDTETVTVTVTAPSSGGGGGGGGSFHWLALLASLAMIGRKKPAA